MTDVEALKIALSKEERAIELYQKFLTEQPNIKEVFSFLLNEEQKHKQLIEKKISEITRF